MRDVWHICVIATETPQTHSLDFFVRNCCYHYLIEASGNEHVLCPENETCDIIDGFNKHTIYVAYVGGVDAHHRFTDNRTRAQIDTMRERLISLKARYPQAKIIGRCDFPFAKTSNPFFNAKKEYHIL